jgi:cyclophilin family peptidyl-prolyl cis-trans isomerase
VLRRLLPIHQSLLPARCLTAAALVHLALLLGGCGGGGGGGSGSPTGETATATSPVITALRTESLKFGSLSTFVATGSHLDDSVKAEWGGDVACAAPSVSRISSSELRIVCTPQDIGILQLSLVSGGKGLKSLTDRVVEPRVLMVIGTGTERRQLEIAVNPGLPGGLQRTWALNFLHYVNSGFYQNTILDTLADMTRIEGGCLIRNAPLNGTPSIKAKAIPTANVFNPEPLVPLVVTGDISNKKYTLAMSPVKCGGALYSSFSLNLNDNSGDLGQRDRDKYVAIGSYPSADPSIQQSLLDLSTLATRTTNNKDLIQLTADELAPRTLSSITQTR